MIEDLIKRKGKSVYKISKESGIPYMTLSDIAKGKTDLRNVNAKTLFALSESMGMSMDELYKSFVINVERQHIERPGNLPYELKESINALIKAIEQGKELIDCELSQVLGDINMSESWGLIDSVRAKDLRKTYVFDILDDIREKEAVNG